MLARNLAYGERIISSGPVFNYLTIDQSNVVLNFSHNGLVSKGGPLQGFELGRSDGSYIFADAQIGGNRVVLSSPLAPNPVAVRYAWANFPRCNLFDEEGLPAAPFRAYVADHAQAADSFTIPLNNPGFEQEVDSVAANSPNWILKKGAQRTNTRASEGKWSLCLPVGGEAAQDRDHPRRRHAVRLEQRSARTREFPPRLCRRLLHRHRRRPQHHRAREGIHAPCAPLDRRSLSILGRRPGNHHLGQAFLTRQIAVTMTPTFDLGGYGTHSRNRISCPTIHRRASSRHLHRHAPHRHPGGQSRPVLERPDG